MSELNSSEPADTPTASLNSEISDVDQYNAEEGPSVAHESDVEEENPMSDAWRHKPRHYFVLTEAGMCNVRLSLLIIVISNFIY